MLACCFCQDAYPFELQGRRRLYNIKGILDSITVKGFPHKTEALTFFAQIAGDKAWLDEVLNFELKIAGPDEEQIGGALWKSVNVIEDSLNCAVILRAKIDLTFSQGGRHLIRLYCDELPIHEGVLYVNVIGSIPFGIGGDREP